MDANYPGYKPKKKIEKNSRGIKLFYHSIIQKATV